MTTDAEMEEKLWHALRSDMTVMLGLADVEDGHSRPMTAQLGEQHGERDGGALWFFTAKDTALVKALGEGHRAIVHFASKGHDLFATIHGELRPDNDRATIDRLWNRFVAAWFEGGKEDPKLQLIRFEPVSAQVWLNEHSLVAGVQLLLGRDPKRDYRDKVAELRLDRH